MISTILLGNTTVTVNNEEIETVVYKTIRFKEIVTNITLTNGAITSEKTYKIIGIAGADNDIQVVGDKQVIINGVNSENNYSRIFEVKSGTITADLLVLQNGKETNGGAVYIAPGAGYIANGGAFYNNKATEYGGAIYVDVKDGVKGKFIANDYEIDNLLYGVKFGSETANTGNTALRGGAIWNKGDVEINGATSFINNKATTGTGATNGSFGGAIYNAGSGEVTITGTSTTSPATFQGNEATGTTIVAPNGVLKGYSGGAIYNTGSGEVSVKNAEFTNNFAGKYGGAISNFATLTVENATFTSNTASSGGAVQTAGTATFTNTTFGGDDKGNTAFGSKYSFDGELDYGGNGGAIFASMSSGATSGGSVTFNGATTFKNNKAANAGGAIDFISGSLTFSAVGDNKLVTVKGNEAGTLGGGLVLAVDPTIIKDPAVTENTFSVSGNSLANVTVTNAQDPFFKTANTGDFAKATDVAAVANVSESNLETIFGKATSELINNEFYTFVRYSQLTSNILSYNDLAHYFTGTAPSKIGVSVDGGETLFLWKDSNVAIDLTNGSSGTSFSFEVKYWDASSSDATPATPNTLFILVDNSQSVQISQFQLPATSGSIPVGIRVRSSQPVGEWKFVWTGPQGATLPETQTIEQYGFTCNAYFNFDATGEYTLKLTAGSSSYTVQITVDALESSGAVLDAEADFFADLDLVDELFED